MEASFQKKEHGGKGERGNPRGGAPPGAEKRAVTKQSRRAQHIHGNPAARAEKKKAEEIREKLEARAAKHSRELLSDYIEQADELIAQIKKQVEKGDEKALFEARRLKKKLENSSQRSGEEHAAPKPKRIGGDPQVGDRVYVPVLKCEATVVSADKARDKYTVAAGIMRTEVRRKDIERLDTGAPSAPKRTPGGGRRPRRGI